MCANSSEVQDFRVGNPRAVPQAGWQLPDSWRGLGRRPISCTLIYAQADDGRLRAVLGAVGAQRRRPMGAS